MKHTFLKRFESQKIKDLRTIKGGSDLSKVYSAPIKGYIVTSDLQDWWRISQNKANMPPNTAIILNDNASNEIRRWKS